MISMEKKGFNVRMMLLFLGLCCLIISSAAVPTTNEGNFLNFKFGNKELFPSSVQDLLVQDLKKSSEAEEVSGEYLGHEFDEERMLMEITDYPPTGASHKHEPFPPPPENKKP
ncbi:hypothetical protein ES319_D07G241900v1 [Gossypium barbadense]|uniref:Transmembrane protein n=2 Tax=Gossypium TaxID=3633 RepID=A0A5J5QYE3_GOSBA|nr:hypothetical protein ES319_D07G241900v1 [Gossypium barbadense]TYG62781.1 hypothetical protein ES288_D07G259800v1 [Gossypium darwinii]